MTAMGSWFTPRRETSVEDNARTGRLLDAADTAFEREPVDGWSADFEATVMEGLMSDVAAPVYPPAGHTYPKRG